MEGHTKNERGYRDQKTKIMIRNSGDKNEVVYTFNTIIHSSSFVINTVLVTIMN